MKAAAVFHYNWPTEFEYIWRRKGNLGCSLCHEFCLSCRAEHKFCVSFLQCKLGVCGSTTYYMRRSFLERHLVGFIFQHKLQWGYWIWGTKPWKSSQSFYSPSLCIELPLIVPWIRLVMASELIAMSCPRPEEMMSFVCSPSQCSPPNVHTKSPLNNNPLSH